MDDRNKRAAENYRRGNEAVQKQNWDLAVEMFRICVILVPDNLMYRQLLRNCTKKKYGDNGKGAGTMSSMKLMGIRSKVKAAKKKEEWKEVDSACEEGLLINPWDTQFNVDLAEASLKLGRGEIARFAYAEAAKSAPKDKAVWLAFGELLRGRGEFQEARKVFEQVKVIDPKDIMINKLINECDVQHTTKRGGYEDADSTKDVKVSRGPSANPGESIAPGQSVETDLRHAIRKEPEKIEHYLKLADHLKKTKKLSESHETLKTALQLSGNDANVRELVEDVELLMLQANLDVARERAQAADSPELRQTAAGLSNELRSRRIEVLSAREQRYPQNLGLKLELALLQMQLQKWAISIPLLQKASQDPRLKTKALVALGKCFVYDKKLPLAKGQFERAIPDLSHEADPETYKEAHYLLARVAEELGDKELAIKHYGEVLVVDYEYKDARDRMEKLQAG